MKKSNKVGTIIFTMCLISGTVLGSVGTTIKAQLAQNKIFKDGKDISKTTNVIVYNNEYYLPTKTLNEVTGSVITFNNGVVSISIPTTKTNGKFTIDDYKADESKINSVTTDNTNPVAMVEALYKIRNFGDSMWLNVTTQCKENTNKYKVICGEVKTPEGKEMAKKYQELSEVLQEEIVKLHDNPNSVDVVEKSLTKINNKLFELNDTVKAFRTAMNQ